MQALRRFYQRLGLALFPFRAGLLLACAGFGLSSVLLVFADAGISQRYLLSSLVLTLWFLFFVSLAYYAASAIPPPKPAAWLRALSWSLRNAWTYLLAVMFLLVTLALLYLSIVAVRIALSHH